MKGVPRLRARRVEVNLEFDSLDTFIREYVSNVSNSGAFIRTDHPLKIGSRVQLRFTIMLDDPEILEGIGRVVRVSNTKPKGMGVVFVHLPESSQKMLERLLTQPRPPRKRRRTTELPGGGSGPPSAAAR